MRLFIALLISNVQTSLCELELRVYKISNFALRLNLRQKISRLALTAASFRPELPTFWPGSTDAKRRSNEQMKRNHRTCKTTKTDAKHHNQHQTRNKNADKRKRRTRRTTNIKREMRLRTNETAATRHDRRRTRTTTRANETTANAEQPKPNATQRQNRNQTLGPEGSNR